ncbi:MAG TPA: leucine--tRNA ligase [Patescibacteria group bacterium]|nr:leucine--tRNA ligase [Patescibacteria group bacterium]
MNKQKNTQVKEKILNQVQDDKIKYDPKAITLKWQAKWEADKLYQTDLENAKKPYYTLMMFPYPSAEGLHIGHIYTFSGADAFARYKRMQGNDVFLPIGLDAFGIHSENYALKIGSNPVEQAKKSEANFYRQFHAIGNSFDWSRKLETNDPNYYKWTQWLFVQLFKHGLAERKKAKVNFCPSCKTVLSDEQVIDGKCERCGTVVEKRDLEQWFLKITEYAQRLLENIPDLNWSEKIKASQSNWIGKSEGAEIEFLIFNFQFPIKIFTTRPDTLYGATFLVIAPEHQLVNKIVKGEIKSTGNIDEIKDYIKQVQNNTEQDRLTEGKEKTGVFSGLYTKHPLTNEQLPIWIADYVLGTYGTGAIMAVPAHDARDFEFAKKYNLPIKTVIKSEANLSEEKTHAGNGEIINSDGWNGLRYPQDKEKILADLEKQGIGKRRSTYHLRDWLISRQRYWGPPIPMIYCENCAKEGKSWFASAESKPTIDDRKWRMGKEDGNLKIDNPSSIFDLQHLSSTVHHPSSNMAGWYPVPEEQLPVLLPYIEDFKPLGTGISPLANHPEFYETVCPECGSKARRETDVSDTFLDSSWYFLRYLATDWEDMPFPTSNVMLNSFQHPNEIPKKILNQVQDDKKIAASPSSSAPISLRSQAGSFADAQSAPRNDEIEKRKRFLPVTIYIGGAEHAVLHLLYARFMTMFLKDAGYLDFEEPFSRFFAHGLIIKDGQKMSKSKGNVILPDPLIEKFGIDTVRLYLRFLGPFDQSGDFRDTGVEGMHRFVKRLWSLFTNTKNFEPRTENIIDDKRMTMLNQTIKGVTEDMEELHFNTAIAKLMTYYNFLAEQTEISLDEAKAYVQMLAPFVPHLAEELWERLGQPYSVHTSEWQTFDSKMLVEDEVTIAIQVNGKVRADLRFKNNDLRNEKMIEEMARNNEKMKKYLEGQTVKKIIYVPGKVINFVI